MAKLAGLLVLCLALIHTGYALQCYNCISKPDSKMCDDFSDEAQIKKITCGKVVADQFQAACIKKVIKDKNTEMMNVTRGCVQIRKDGDTKAECKAPSDKYDVTACDVCMDDLCNASNQINFNLYTFIASVTMLFLVKYLN
ncbi:PREDICTED: uncharacterized protein LOC108567465 [Nicrophorus vespilloides]|uniref:Uncharacterized protein LOC108567465 n=1 Tax=Nicrophorus vespilloides TaxID=110193 RepID=A0ABM1N9E6_NICVS|nr:PREDICTED: uncharacterized protein LOC108567465 [Nicrophorus vespilloides]